MTPVPGGHGLAAIAAAADVSESDVRHWIDLGLLSLDGRDPDAVSERARLLGVAMRRGIAVSSIAAACERDPGLLGRFETIIGRPDGSPRPVEQAARDVGLEPAFARRLRIAGGMDADAVHDDDLEALRAARTALDVGLPAEALLQLVRVLADSLARVADAEVRLFHFYVHERLRAEGGADEDVAAATDTATAALVSLMEPAIAYFHRKAWQAALQEDMLAHFAAEVAAPGQPLNQLPVAVLFVDLARFTPLTDAMGDVAAAEVIDLFSDMVREQAATGEGRVVKQIGDEFMLVFPAAGSAFRFALRLARRAAGTARFPSLRMGAHFGTALYREADYLGATVNIAARVTAAAGAGELVVTGAFRQALGDVPAAFEDLGPRALKGVVDQVDLHRVALGGGRHERADPVCGMRLDATDEPPATTWQGVTYEFCSDPCLRRFQDAPGRYLVEDGATGAE